MNSGISFGTVTVRRNRPLASAGSVPSGPLVKVRSPGTLGYPRVPGLLLRGPLADSWPDRGASWPGGTLNRQESRAQPFSWVPFREND